MNNTSSYPSVEYIQSLSASAALGSTIIAAIVLILELGNLYYAYQIFPLKKGGILNKLMVCIVWLAIGCHISHLIYLYGFFKEKTDPNLNSARSTWNQIISQASISEILFFLTFTYIYTLIVQWRYNFQIIILHYKSISLNFKYSFPLSNFVFVYKTQI